MIGLGNSRNVNTAMRRRSLEAEIVSVSPALPPTGICDLAVHLDGSLHDEGRIAFSELLALTFGARIEACLSNCFTVAPISGFMAGGWQNEPYGSSDLSSDGSDELRLRARVALIGAVTTFRRFDGVEFELGLSLSRRARTVDLFVVGRPYGAGSPSPQFVEKLLFDASAAVVVVPPELPRLLDLQTIIIGWKDTPGCSRAVAASLPFLKQASRVYLASVSEGSDDGLDRASATEMASHLSHHGISVEVRTVTGSGEAAECLLEEARTVGADLVVAGAYGRSRLSELILGSATRHLLTYSTIPLLLAH